MLGYIAYALVRSRGRSVRRGREPPWMDRVRIKSKSFWNLCWGITLGQVWMNWIRKSSGRCFGCGTGIQSYAIRDLEKPEEINKVFMGFQKYLCLPGVAGEK